MKKLLYFLSFSMIVSTSWSQTPSGCFSSGNDASFTSLGTASALIHGDFDNDGITDIMNASNSVGNPAPPRLQFFKGLSNGKVAPYIQDTAGSSIANIKTADVNGDGILDLIAANNGLNMKAISVHYGQGDGTFMSGPVYTAPGTTIYRSLDLGDINNDGIIDILAMKTDSAFVMLGSSVTPGTFNLYPASGIKAASGNLSEVKLGDFNNDGLLDIAAIGGASRVSVYLNNAGTPGTFGAPTTTVLSGATFTGSSPIGHFVITHLNNDAFLDIVTSNEGTNNISVLFGNGAGGMTFQTHYTVGTQPRGIDSYDINADGNKDIVVVNFQSAKLHIFYGSSTGTLNLNTLTQCPGTPSKVVICNIDADTYPEIVVSNQQTTFINIFHGNSSLNYLLPDIHAAGNAPKSIASADFNGDGKKDLVIANSGDDNFQLFLGNGTGGFTSGGTFATGTLPSSIISGDLNNDGKADVVTANFSSNNISVFYGNGAGGFMAASNYSTQNGPIQVRMGQLDNDGFMDLVVANQTTGSISVLLSSGGTGFNAAVNYPTNASAAAIAIFDRDADTDNDILVGHNATGSVLIKFTNTGTGSGAFTNAGNVGTATISNVTSMEATDLDGDSDVDVVLSYLNGIIKVFNVNGTGSIATLANTIGSGNTPGRDLEILDINSDGRIDVAGVYSPTGQSGHTVISMASLTGTNTTYTLTNGPKSFTCEIGAAGITSGDFDGDGRIDLAVVNEVSNSFNIHFNKTPKITAGGPLTFCNGNSVTLTSTPALWYDWSPNGETTQAISATASGTYYTTTSSSWSDWCSSSSNSLAVSVSPGPSAPTITPGGATTFCAGGSVTLTSSQSTGNQWYKDGVLITGATNSTYSATTAGVYTVTYTNAGCTSPQSGGITVTTSQTPTITADGPITFCAGGSVTLTSDVTTNITWSNGATTPSIVVTSAGTYYVTNTVGACPPLQSNSIVVTVGSSLSTPTISPAGPVNLCPGGSVTLTSSSATNNIWSNGATTQSITVNTAGSYYVHLDNGSCSSPNSAPVTVNTTTAPAAPTITPSGATTFCAGGSVTLTSSTGTSYLWSNGATTQSINVTTSGSYTVQVTNASGCQSPASAPTAVTVNPAPAAPAITPGGATTFCTGGSVTLTSSAGTTYLWSNGATTQSINVTTSGSYTVQITDANGCQSPASAPTTVTVNPAPTAPSITPGGATTFCTGGSVTLTSSAGTSYLWSTGETTQSINVTTSGSYTVQVTNPSGCQSPASAPTTVTVNSTVAAPSITPSGATTFCSGGSVTLTSSSGNSYLWSTGETTQSIVVTTSGSYTVQVTNASGCQSPASAPTTVTVDSDPTPPTITPGGATTFCTGGSVTLTASSGTSYLWSNGATTQSINVTTSGSYTVQVTNATGCQSPASAPTVVTVNSVPAAPSITPGGATTFCTGGSVTLTASTGTSYLWSNGETTASITVTASGTYTVQVSNGAGCQSPASAPTTVTVNPAPAAPSITSGGATTFCAGGSVTLTSSTGTSYLWSNGATTQSISVTTSGSYTVQVTNGSSCQSPASAPTTVTVNPAPAAPSITPGGATTFCNGGSVTLTASAGVSYLWSNGATTASINVTTSGTYTVKITDANGCQSPSSAPTTVTVNPKPATPTISSGSTNICYGNTVTLTSSAGTSYLWSTGATTQSITVGTSGSYTVQVGNSFGCLSNPSAPKNVNVTVTVTTPSINANGPVTFCEGGSVTLTAAPGFSFIWSTGNTTQSITVDTSGTYTVQRVNNFSGCISNPSAPVTVTVNPIPAAPSITPGGPTTFCNGESVTLTSSPDASYLWSTGETTQSITVSAAGPYTVQITDANGCQSPASTPTIITVNPNPAVPVITASGATTFCDGGSVTLTSSTETGYLWSTGETTQSIVVTSSGAYSVEVSNGFGCTTSATAPMNVTVNPNPTVPVITSSGPVTFCDGGSVTLTSSAASGNLWSTGETTQSIVVTNSGAYSVEVTNGFGCSTPSAATNVTVNPIPAVPTITAGGPTTFCDGGSVTLTSSAPSGNLWSTGETTQSIVVATSGAYSVELVELGCSSGASAAETVTVNPNPSVPVITASGPITFCDGGSVTLTSSAASNNLWSTGETTQSIMVTASGAYSVEVANGFGCSTSSAVTTVTENPIPATPSITAGGPTTFCSGSSVILTSSASSGNTWSTGETTQSITVSASGVYTVNQTVAGCTSPNASQTITVNPIPAAPSITAGGPTTFCAGGSVVLTSSASSGNTWSTSETTQSITVSASGSYTVTQTQLGCTSAPSAPMNIIVNTIPAVPTITASGPTTFCAGGSVVLTSSSATNNLWSNGATTQSITVSSSGTFLVQVITNGCTSGTSAPKTVTVNTLPPSPTIVTGTTESICDGSSVTLTSSSTGGNLWSTGETTQSIVVSTAGNYTVTVTDGNGCTSPSSSPTVVTVNPLPAAPLISESGPVSFCSGGSVTLTSSYASNNLWSSGSTANSITVSSNGTYTVTATDANGCVSPASAPVTITVNPIPAAPVITPSGPTTFCSGDSVTLSSSEPNGNSWSTSAMTQDITVTTSGVYSVIFIDGNGCASASSLPISVNVLANPPAPSITAGGATTLCQGSFVTLTSSYTSGNTWSNGGITQNINATVSGNYTVTYTNSNGCSSTSSPVTVTVIPVSSIPTISASGSTTICDGESVTLTSSDSNSTWSTGASSQSITVTVSGSYSVVGNQTGCPSQPSAPVVVTVNPSPATPLITPSGSTTICEGEELFLFTSGSGTNTWSTGHIGPVLSVTASGNYWVSVENVYGCSSVSEEVPVVVNPSPVVTIDPFDPLCSYASPFTLANGSPAGGNYEGDGITTNIFYPAQAGVGASIVTYTYTDVNGCSNMAQTTIEVNDCVGIEENEEASFSVFPNPNNGVFKITSTGAPMEQVIIYDAQGKMVFNEAYSGLFTLEFDLNLYANGVYYIEINSDQEIRDRIPLVINH